MSNNMTKEKLEKIIYRLIHELKLAKDCLSVFRTINDAKEHRRREVQSAIGFFDTAQRSAKYTLYMMLCNLYESDSRNEVLSISKLINICEQNQSIFPDRYVISVINAGAGNHENWEIPTDNDVLQREIKSWKDGLKELSSTITKLNTWRNKYFAHNSKEVFYKNEGIFEAVTEVEIESLLNFALIVCKEALSELSHSDFDITTYGLDLIAFIDSLQSKPNDVPL